MKTSNLLRTAAALLITTGFAACQDDPQSVSAPAVSFNAVSGDVVPGQFIVTLRSGSNPETVAREFGVRPDYLYRTALNGFAGSIAAAARDGLLRDARVLRVEPDRVVKAFETQTGATWGLDRIDQRSGLDGTYTYTATGAGVTAYIIDTGILYNHAQFGGRATFGYDAFGGNGSDCNGHGTHVAGTTGGTTYGVAKAVSLVAVRVLDCGGSGTTSGVIAGVDWVTANHSGPAVANMSLGGGASASLDQAVANSIASGVAYAVAAGNGNMGGRAQDACNYSPARVPSAMTIGATNNTDTKASWSNYGNCVDFFAPGVSITSAWYTSTTATNTISGTSMAAPHVAGVAALYVQENPGATPQQVRDALYAATTKSVVKSSSTTNNHLLYSLFGDAPPPTNAAPVANFSFACTELACAFTDLSTDSDGSIASRSWNFGDATSSSATNPSHTYGAAGTYSVMLTVTDDDGAGHSVTKSVTVSEAPPTGGISLAVVGYKVKGAWTADLTWSGAASSQVDVWRGVGSAAFSKVATRSNSAGTNTYTDATNLKGGGTLTYRVCEAGTTTCSPDRTVSF